MLWSMETDARGTTWVRCTKYYIDHNGKPQICRVWHTTDEIRKGCMSNRMIDTNTKWFK